ncbi:hypothetical protein HK097_007985, partial [Rhizophlyctis rosea]
MIIPILPISSIPSTTDASPSDLPPQPPTRQLAPPTEADFLTDVSALLETTSLSAAARLAAASRLVEARSRWTGTRAQADDAYWKERDVILKGNGRPDLSKSREVQGESATSGSAAHEIAQAPEHNAKRRQRPTLTSLPPELFHQILLYLSHPKITLLSLTSKPLHTLIHTLSQPLYRTLCSHHFHIPIDSPSGLRALFIDNPSSADWKDIYVTRWNLMQGRYKFRIVGDVEGLEERKKREEVVETWRMRREGGYIDVKGRKYVLQVGQPTTAV